VVYVLVRQAVVGWVELLYKEVVSKSLRIHLLYVAQHRQVFNVK